MDVLLLTNRPAPGFEPWALPLLRTAAATLLAGGHRVRWLAAVGRGEAPPVLDGVEVKAVPGRAPSFRKVQGRVSDARFDVELTRWLRDRPADLVHALGFGAPGSVATLWLAERMGARGVATVRAAEVLCHRGTLVHASGAECAVWDDVERCLSCCTAPWQHGLRRWQSVLARALRFLGGLSPMPSKVEFLNRLELAIGGLGYAQRILVGSEPERERLLAAGIPGSRIVVGDLQALHADRLLREYAAAV